MADEKISSAKRVARERPVSARPSHPLYELTVSRVREFVREPEALFWVFVFPVLLAFALGIAFRNKPEDRRMVAVADGSAQAAKTFALLSRSPELAVTLMPEAAAAQALRTGKADLVVKAPEAAAGTAPTYTFRFDPTRSDSRLARLLADQTLQRGEGRKDVITVQEEKAMEPGARYIDFFIPGLIGMNLMGSGMWGIGFNVVQSRTRKLMKRLAATPMRRPHYLLSFMLSRLIFLIPEVAALVVFGWLMFGVEVRGSIAALAVISLLGSMTFAGLGLLVAARSQSIEAVSGWINFVMIPMWLLSGSFFSYQRFPAFLHPFIRALPLTAVNDALRAVMNAGAPLASSWLELGVLLAWGLLSFVVALKIFRWQ